MTAAKNANIPTNNDDEYAMDEHIPVPNCGARTRSGKPCRHPAGYGTETPGVGRCIYHGGGLQTHGAYSVQTTDAKTGVLVGHLRDILAGEPQAILSDADLPVLESAAVLIRQRHRLAEWLEANGPVDEDGKIRPAVDALVRISRVLLEHAGQLGMTPSARARLGLDVARTASVADEFARMHRRRGNE